MIYLRCNALVPMDHGLALGSPLECPIEVARGHVSARAQRRSDWLLARRRSESRRVQGRGKTFDEAPTISNGSDAHVTRRKGEYIKNRLDREFPYQFMLPAERCMA